MSLHRLLPIPRRCDLSFFLVASDHVQELLAYRVLTPHCLGFGDNWFFAAMPVVRTFFTGGHFAVSVFFVISGYVLSAKPLSLIHSGETVKLGDNLASALFRRWLRLYIPVFVTTWMYLTSWHLFGIWTVSPNHEANYRDELWKFYVEFKNYSFAFRTGGEDWLSYNFPTWSIPVEFRGSIIIYTTILAFSRCSKNMRLFGMVGLIFYFMYIVDGWFGSLFMAGTYCITPFFPLRLLKFPSFLFGNESTNTSLSAGSLLCYLDLLARNDQLPRFFKKLEHYKMPIFYSFFISGMFLSGVPSHSSTYPTPCYLVSQSEQRISKNIGASGSLKCFQALLNDY